MVISGSKLSYSLTLFLEYDKITLNENSNSKIFIKKLHYLVGYRAIKCPNNLDFSQLPSDLLNNIPIHIYDLQIINIIQVILLMRTSEITNTNIE